MEKKKSSPIRFAYIDFLKAFAIFTVVLGHTCHNYANNIDEIVEQYGIVPYHMPLFAVLSGLFFSTKTDAKTFLVKKFRQIALPFLVWCAIASVDMRGLIEVLLSNNALHTNFIFTWAEWFWLYIVDIGWWFLRALFLSFIAAYFCIRIFKSTLKGVCVSVLILHLLTLSGVIPNRSISNFLFIYPFFCSGILMNEYKDSIFRHANNVLLVSITTFLVCMFFWQGASDSFYGMNTSMVELEGAGVTGWMVLVKTIYRFTTGVSASIAFILLARRYEKFLPKPQIVMSIGRNTLGIYILHEFAWQIYPPHSDYLFENKLLSFIVCLCVSIILVVLCNYIVKFTSRIKYLALLLWGKR